MNKIIQKEAGRKCCEMTRLARNQNYQTRMQTKNDIHGTINIEQDTYHTDIRLKFNIKNSYKKRPQ